jgi:hypothetical protein
LEELVLCKRWFSWFRPLKSADRETIDFLARKSNQTAREQNHVGIKEFTIWTESFRLRTLRRQLEGQCITGVVNLADDPHQEKHLVPFVAFRGTKVMTDVLRDIRALVTKQYVSEKGKKSDGEVGVGFAEMFEALKKHKVEGKTLLEEIFCLVAKYDNGLVITGHSLGGSCALIFLLELMLDHMDLLNRYGKKIRLVTFGCPRTVNNEIAKQLNALPITNLRFVNNDDFVTNVIPKSLDQHHVGRVFYPYTATNTDQLTNHRNPLDALPDWITLLSKNQEHTLLWMEVYNPSSSQDSDGFAADGNFSANSLPDRGFAKKYRIPSAFLTKGIGNTHSMVNVIGYNRVFQNYVHVEQVDDIYQLIASRAKLFLENQLQFSHEVSQKLKV